MCILSHENLKLINTALVTSNIAGKCIFRKEFDTTQKQKAEGIWRKELRTMCLESFLKTSNLTFTHYVKNANLWPTSDCHFPVFRQFFSLSQQLYQT